MRTVIYCFHTVLHIPHNQCAHLLVTSFLVKLEGPKTQLSHTTPQCDKHIPSLQSQTAEKLQLLKEYFENYISKWNSLFLLLTKDDQPAQLMNDRSNHQPAPKNA